MAQGLYDLDYIKYTAASAAEIRTIKVLHEGAGILEEFKNQTEFVGRKRSKDGGWLAQHNEKNGEDLKFEDFSILTKQKALPFNTVEMIADKMISKDIDQSRMDSVRFYIGGGDDYRECKSTLLKYKGNREGAIKPILLKETEEYLIRKYGATVVTDIECDDQLVIDAYKRKDRVVMGVDKDFYAQPVKFYNCNRPEEGVVDCAGLGELRKQKKSGKNSIRGFGRKFLYWQMCAGDTADGYKPTCFSESRFGEIAAYNALVDCRTDKECIESMVKVFKNLYPKPKQIIGWRGDSLKIDWLYVMNEMFQMARMLRYEGDEINIVKVMEGLGVETNGNN